MHFDMSYLRLNTKGKTLCNSIDINDQPCTEMDGFRFDLTAPPGSLKRKRKFHSIDALSAFFKFSTEVNARILIQLHILKAHIITFKVIDRSKME